jgi:hypothetical protein
MRISMDQEDVHVWDDGEVPVCGELIRDQLDVQEIHAQGVGHEEDGILRI